MFSKKILKTNLTVLITQFLIFNFIIYWFLFITHEEIPHVLGNNLIEEKISIAIFRHHSIYNREQLFHKLAILIR